MAKDENPHGHSGTGHCTRREEAEAWSTPLPHAGTYLCPPVLQQRP